MPDIREVLRSEEVRSRRRDRQPVADDAQHEGAHVERERALQESRAGPSAGLNPASAARQRLIQRERTRRREFSDDPDGGSNEWF
jgi:hypothetical protein